MSIQHSRSTVHQRRHSPAGPTERGSSTHKETARDFGVVSWLAAIGTITAVALVVTYPTITDLMWMFSQVP